MKIIKLSLILILFISNYSYSQQWIDKKYTYDSLYNVTYGSAINFNGESETLKMDLYTPICSNPLNTDVKPLILFIHGGAFLTGNKSDPSITYLCQQFAKRGYITASIDYRLGIISDQNAWSCNYPNYNCVFAADTAEWHRAEFRATQDAKGALRYLINRHNQYKIDLNNIFIAGESAGAITALNTALLDTSIEKPLQTYAIADAPKPSANASNCNYNLNKVFNNLITRPDLGSIDGNIEPSNINYTIKGVGNMFGAISQNLLKHKPTAKPKPAIFSFHQPCDLVVPIDSAKQFSGLSWCFTNGYNCYAIFNTVKLYGSQAISNLNTNNNYGYNIHNEFTNNYFPYSFLFGTGSCADQINNPCHGYDNSLIRENNMATFFANLINTTTICTPAQTYTNNNTTSQNIKIYQNQTNNQIIIYIHSNLPTKYKIINILGQCIQTAELTYGKNEINLANSLNNGTYFLTVWNNKSTQTQTIFNIK